MDSSPNEIGKGDLLEKTLHSISLEDASLSSIGGLGGSYYKSADISFRHFDSRRASDSKNISHLAFELARLESHIQCCLFSFFSSIGYLALPECSCCLIRENKYRKAKTDLVVRPKEVSLDDGWIWMEIKIRHLLSKDKIQELIKDIAKLNNIVTYSRPEDSACVIWVINSDSENEKRIEGYPDSYQQKVEPCDFSSLLNKLKDALRKLEYWDKNGSVPFSSREKNKAMRILEGMEANEASMKSIPDSEKAASIRQWSLRRYDRMLLVGAIWNKDFLSEDNQPSCLSCRHLYVQKEP